MFYARRERFRRLSWRIGTFFARFGLSPNQWTMVTFIPLFISMAFLIYHNFLPGAVFFIIAGFIDMVDGAVARVMDDVSRKGAYLDSMVDRYVEFLVIAALFFSGLPPFVLPAEFWLLLYLFGGMATTYAKAAAKERNIVTVELKGGLLERAERLIVLFVGILLGSVELIYTTYFVIILAAGSNFTAFQRMAKAVRMARF